VRDGFTPNINYIPIVSWIHTESICATLIQTLKATCYTLLLPNSIMMSREIEAIKESPTPRPLCLPWLPHDLKRQAYWRHAFMVRSWWLKCIQHSFFKSSYSYTWLVNSLTFTEPKHSLPFILPGWVFKFHSMDFEKYEYYLNIKRWLLNKQNFVANKTDYAASLKNAVNLSVA
jgi:hypothetical protein